MDVFQIVQIFENRRASIVGLGAPSFTGKLIEPFFDLGRKADGEHGERPQQEMLYKSSITTVTSRQTGAQFFGGEAQQYLAHPTG